MRSAGSGCSVPLTTAAVVRVVKISTGGATNTHSSGTELVLPTTGRQEKPVEVELPCVCMCVVFVVFFFSPTHSAPHPPHPHPLRLPCSDSLSVKTKH